MDLKTKNLSALTCGQELSTQQRAQATDELNALKSYATIGDKLTNLFCGEDWAKSFIRLLELRKQQYHKGLNNKESLELFNIEVAFELEHKFINK